MADEEGVEIRGLTQRAADAADKRAEEIKALRGAWTTGGGTEELLAERRRERELEEIKAQRWLDADSRRSP